MTKATCATLTAKHGLPVADGNHALLAGNIAVAVACYIRALQQIPSFSKSIGSSLAIARQRYRLARAASNRQTVAVCGWELSHNAAGRVITLANIYEKFADVEIIGSHFKPWGTELWPPIRSTTMVHHSIVVADASSFLDQAVALVAAHPYDIVHLSKPRAPNIIFGLLYKLIWDAKVLLDIDDEELAFAGAEAPVGLDDWLGRHDGVFPELKRLTQKDWTQLAVGLSDVFDGVTVANIALQQRYGGVVLPHARDEQLFSPSAELKRRSREKFGIPAGKKVVMFFGTPREHKGLLESAQAIAELGRDDVVYFVVGDFPQAELKKRLQQVAGVDFCFAGNQPFDAIPDVVACADICLLLQGEESLVSRFQTPAKLSDALAMGVPVLVLVSPNLPLQAAIAEGAIQAVLPSDLGAALGLLLSQPERAQSQGDAGRAYFLRHMSLAVTVPVLQQAVAQACALRDAGPDFPDFRPLDPRLLLLAQRVFGPWAVLAGQGSGLIPPPALSGASPALQSTPAPGILSSADAPQAMQQVSVLTQDLLRLGDSGLFDETYYLSQQPALVGQPLHLQTHYLTIGRFSGASPHPAFDARFYALAHAAHLVGGEDPFLHYLRQGAVAGLALRSTAEQELAEAPALRYQVLNTALIDWQAQAARPRQAGLVSVIVPVYGQLALTQACVSSILQHTALGMFELVLVDNGSDAGTEQGLQDIARQHPGCIHLIRNAGNLNFALGSNLGAAASLGETLVFLNNDTVVTAGWLPPLVASLQTPGVGVAQPLLLYPDGRIKSMGIVFSEHSALGYPLYHGLAWDGAWAWQGRALNAVTGACMAVQAKNFLAMRGFDPLFINGQEDVDFCLQMRAGLGLGGWYCAGSMVYHHESKTSGRHRFNARNRALFIGRHGNPRMAPDDRQHFERDGLTVKEYRPESRSAANQDPSTLIWRPVFRQEV